MNTKIALNLNSETVPKDPSLFSAIGRLIFLLGRKEKKQWLLIVFFAFMSSILELLAATVIVAFAQILTNPASSEKYLTRLGISMDVNSAKLIYIIALIFGLIYLVKNSFSVFLCLFQSKIVQQMNYVFKCDLLLKYCKLDYALYLTRNSSFGYNTIEGDADGLFSTGVESFSSLVSETLVFIFLIAMVVAVNPSLAILVFILGGIVFYILKFHLFPFFYNLGMQSQEVGFWSQKNLFQFFHGFKEVILLGKINYFANQYTKYSKKKSQIHAVKQAATNIPRSILELFFVFIFVISVCYMNLTSKNSAEMISILAAYLYTGFRLLPGINRSINLLNNIKMTLPSIERVYTEHQMLVTNDSFFDQPQFVFNKNIVFKNVCFKYLNTSNYVLKDVNLEINKGDCIGIIGTTGSGKSTLVDLLLGLLKPDQGSIYVDGHYSVQSIQWHRKIGYVPQAIYLLDDTICANIAFGENVEDVDMARVQQAVKSAQLQPFIDSLPNGLSTTVGERGIRLSGGERQRVAIARALYRNPEVLIFDEATSALDNDTEAKLMKTIDELTTNRTVIMIAHRLSSLTKCNKIIKVNAGKVDFV